MSENLKTIKELADELGVSKQTIHYHIKSLSNIKRDKNNKGAVLLNEEEQKFIYSKVNAVKDDTVKDNTVKDNTVKDNTVKDNTVKDDTVKDDTVKDNTVKGNTVKGNTAHFLSEIQFLRTQLENKDTQILQMQNLLDQQQRLALQDKKLLEEYKSEIQSLKALTTEDNKAHSEEHSEDANIGVKDKSKRWWRFGK
ncbi:HTH domain-containing protein [Lactococcus cremoris]|nr:HTH domain-containing protein [Lactococcus cremoris]